MELEEAQLLEDNAKLKKQQEQDYFCCGFVEFESADDAHRAGKAHHVMFGKTKVYIKYKSSSYNRASIALDFDVSTGSFCDKKLVLNQIKSKRDSAAFAVCEMPLESRPQDVLGVVALLGTVQCVDLSRMLAAYIGEDQMLAIACRNYAAAYHLKENNLAARGYNAVCLEEIRTRFLEPSSDPQQLLPLSDGNVPPGFLGYAVNMIDIDESYTEWRTQSGYGLRETLFFRLFGELQVYKDNESLFAAKACIKEGGALSLDGCIMRGNGLVSLGSMETPEILFPVMNTPSPRALQALQWLNDKNLDMSMLKKRIQEEQEASDKLLSS